MIKRIGFTVLLIGQFLFLSCGSRKASQQDTTAVELGPPGVTRNMPAGKIATFCCIDIVGDMPYSIGKDVSVFRSRPLRVVGWVVDFGKKLPASNVDVVIDGVAYAAHYGISRKDVLAATKEPAYEKSGFEFLMPGGLLAQGKHKLSVRVVSPDGHDYFQSPNIVVTVE